MNSDPSSLSAMEWQEIAMIPAVQQAWGLDAEKRNALGAELQAMAFGAKFDFVSGGPGYVGELFTIYGDSLCEPMTLTRNQSTKALEIVGDVPTLIAEVGIFPHHA